MNAQRQRSNWWLDALLLVGFLFAMLLDVTGLGWHQWLGIALPALAFYHLVRHWQWVKTVSGRFFGKTSATARRFYLVDAALLTGLLTIALTGLVISSWLNLTLANYAAWHTVHVAASVVSLGLLVLKVGLHWRWIVSTLRRYVLPPRRVSVPGGTLEPVPVRVTRRDFIGLMSAVGALSVVAAAQALSGEVSAANATAETGTRLTTTVDEAAASTTCAVACNRRCSYPGQCRRYTDSNGNGRCDLGECGSGNSSAANSGAGSTSSGTFGGFTGRGAPGGRRGRHG